MPVIDYDLEEHESYAGSEEALNNLPPLSKQDWTADDINKLRTVLANHTLYLLGLGERGDLTTAAKDSFVEAINSLISDTATGANQTWSAQKIATAISESGLTVAQLQAIQAETDALEVAINTATASIATVDSKAQTGIDNAASADAKANQALTRIDSRLYGATSAIDLTINAALVGTQPRYHQLFDTTSNALTATIANDIAEGRELVINRARGSNALTITTGDDVLMPDGSLASSVVLDGRGLVLMKMRSTGWEVLEAARH